MLTRRGVTAWRRALTDLTPEPGPGPAASTAHATDALPAPIAAELVDALAGLVLAGT